MSSVLSVMLSSFQTKSALPYARRRLNAHLRQHHNAQKSAVGLHVCSFCKIKLRCRISAHFSCVSSSWHRSKNIDAEFTVYISTRLLNFFSRLHLNLVDCFFPLTFPSINIFSRIYTLIVSKFQFQSTPLLSRSSLLGVFAFPIEPISPILFPPFQADLIVPLSKYTCREICALEKPHVGVSMKRIS